jgi:hypothetical protein
MKRNRILICILFASVILHVNCMGQMKEKQKMANDFIGALLDDSQKSQSIAERYVKYNKNEASPKFLISHIDAIKDDLKKQEIKLSDLQVVSFKNAIASSEKARDKIKSIVTTNENDGDLFAVLNKDEMLFPIKITDQKVVSFSTMNKGGKRFFIEY